MKSKISFVCQECGYDSPAFLGKCPECGAWNSMKEFQVQKSNLKNQNYSAKIKNIEPRKLSEIKFEDNLRISTGFSEADTVFGGGIVPGSVTLLAGDPGIGKSTLLLQVALNVAGKLPKSPRSPKLPILYVSAEESEEQVKMRALRLTTNRENDLMILSETDTDSIVSQIEKLKPALIIMDSIQTISSDAIDAMSGSVSQVRYATSQLVRSAKTNRVPIIIVGHVTKEGMVAGPMVLSHMVDTVLFLEGEKTTQSRVLRSFKNRFGPVDEVGIFFMEQKGMKEAKNTEQIFLTEKRKKAPGSVLTVILEGTRSFLVEIQALAVFSKLPFPKRVVSGTDSRRIELLLAILQKHCNLRVDTMDTFVNVAGGMKISDTASDLAICLAIFSSIKNLPLSDIVAISEVGLLGELRNVSLLEKRTKEAKKLGFKRIISTEKYNSIKQVLSSLG